MKKLLILPILLIGLLILSGCNNKQISEGDNITVSYDSFLQDGKIIEEGKEISFTVGMGQTFPIFDTIVVGMKEGETKKFTATAQEGYKIYHDNAKIQNISKTVFNKIGKEPKTGEIISLGDMKGLILETGPITNKVDFNEPETHEDVEFKIKILEIE
ncbi:MAG TPA: FKBP-type peptidyl-prolyl cis-trans isomerase [Candidatus Absconditabacterales bacterium]|nr:FKBP-type peptidyl-prolyl cis-trans isomerase [Candidatus Absconditabacterales bacterium]